MIDDILTSNEPLPLWGGDWTEQKLDAFEKYVNAYLTILNKHRDRYDWKLVYFDGFAGSGTRGIKEEEEFPRLFDNSELGISEKEVSVYAGAAERVLKIEKRGFDYYYFNEPHEESLESLKSKLIPSIGNKRVEFRKGDANNELLKLAQGFKNNNKLKGLVLLDPFGMQINRSSIDALKGCSLDLWILVPTGVITNRLLDRKGKLHHTKKLQKFFGMEEDKIKAFFYRKQNGVNIFGEEEENLIKLPNAISRISELYIDILKEIFKEVSSEPLTLYNTKGVPIYNFIFASNNPTAAKIASQIIGKS